jgi:hypothetical protein
MSGWRSSPRLWTSPDVNDPGHSGQASSIDSLLDSRYGTLFQSFSFCQCLEYTVLGCVKTIECLLTNSVNVSVFLSSKVFNQRIPGSVVSRAFSTKRT